MTRKNFAVRAARVLGMGFCAAVPLLAAAGQPGYYAAVHGGGNNLNGWPATVDFGAGIAVPGRLALDGGGHGGLVFGRQTEHARFELEYQQGRAKVSGVSLGAVNQPANGSVRYELFTINAYRTHEFTERFGAFVGAGIGRGRAKLPALAPVNGCNCFAAAADGGTVYQLRLGAEYALTGRDHLFGQYTAMRLPAVAASGAPSVSYPHRSVGALSIGYRRSF